MAIESAENEYITYLVNLMKTIGPVNAKKMFGGYGIFLEGLMFALVADNTLYLKADQETENVFKDKGLGKFVYHKKGKPYAMSYYQAPEEVFEEDGDMRIWGAYGLCFSSSCSC